MKKVLLLLAILPMIMTSCSKDDDEAKEQTFFVNVYKKWQDSDEELVKNAFVYIFPLENKSIDNSKSAESVVDDGLITYSDGSMSAKPKHATKFKPGVLNMENIANGEYILWVTHMADYGGTCYSSYKKISVNNGYNGTTEKKVFLTKTGDTGLYIFQNW